MKAIPVVALLFFLTASQAQDFDTGMAAFEQQDYAKAFEILGAAAAAGDADAQFMMGRMYARGLGVLQDFVLSHHWYNLAASQGQRMAARARDALAENMTPEQIAQAQKMAQDASAAVTKPETLTVRPADVTTSSSSSSSAPVRLVPRPADVAAKTPKAVVVAAPRASDSGTRASDSDSESDNMVPVISATSSSDSTQIQVSESTIARIQLGLRRLGYGIDAATGKLDEKTSQAIREFQKKSRLPVDGRATPALLGHVEARLRGRPSIGGGSDQQQEQEEDSGVRWKRLL